MLAASEYFDLGVFSTEKCLLNYVHPAADV